MQTRAQRSERVVGACVAKSGQCGPVISAAQIDGVTPTHDESRTPLHAVDNICLECCTCTIFPVPSFPVSNHPQSPSPPPSHTATLPRHSHAQCSPLLHLHCVECLKQCGAIIPRAHLIQQQQQKQKAPTDRHRQQYVSVASERCAPTAR